MSQSLEPTANQLALRKALKWPVVTIQDELTVNSNRCDPLDIRDLFKETSEEGKGLIKWSGPFQRWFDIVDLDSLRRVISLRQSADNDPEKTFLHLSPRRKVGKESRIARRHFVAKELFNLSDVLILRVQWPSCEVA